MKKTETNLMILTGIFVTSLLIANIVSSKIVMIGSFVVPAAIVAYPITFLMTDVIGEIWGKRQANLTVMIGFICQIVSIVLISVAILLPVAPFANNQSEFKAILLSTFRVVLASMVAYVFSQSWDVFVFHKIKDKSVNRRWIRNNLSTLSSQIIDTAIFITIAFYGTVPSILTMVLSQYCVKAAYALIDTPFFYILTRSNSYASRKEKIGHRQRSV